MKYNFEIEITLKCNLKCDGCNRLCNITSFSDSDMTSEEFSNIMNEILLFNKHNIINTISILGGEPTLNPYIMDICKLLNDIPIKCSKRIITNNINDYIVDNIKRMFKNIDIVFQNIDLNNKHNTKQVKNNSHVNFLMSPYEKNMEVENWKDCRILKYVGISIRKIYGKIKYFWCAPGNTLCILLKRPEYQKDNLKDLLDSDINILHNICKHCMHLAKNPIMIIENNSISKYFIESITDIKDYDL